MTTAKAFVETAFQKLHTKRLGITRTAHTLSQHRTTNCRI